jgi:long-chain acyl-CoA synthetase
MMAVPTSSARERDARLPRTFRSMTMAEGLRAAAARDPAKIAAVCGDDRRTFGELMARIERAANATVTDLGLKKGQTAAIISKNCIEYLEITCGLPHAGVAVATVNAKLTVLEAAAICDDAGAEVLFVDETWAPKVDLRDFATVKRIIALGGDYEAWLDLGAAPAILPMVDEWDAWTIPYTSGTTGKPKGVILSHRSRILNFAGMGVEYGCYGPEGRFLAMTPMNHGAGLCFALAAIFFGGSVDILQAFDAEQVLSKLKHGGFSGVFMVPTHFHAIFGLDRATLEAHRRPPIKTIICNAAPLPQAMKPRILDYFGEDVLFECYGSTEASIVSNLRPADQLRKEQCVGQPFAMTEIELRRDDGSLCDANEVGELFSRSPFFFNGYRGQDEATDHAWRDGWVSVGDMARRDAEGYLYIVDRKKDLVISGGVNIYPREIEEVLNACPEVEEAAVIGVPDARWGERLKAFVTAAPSATPNLEVVTAFCAGRLAPYKTPREIVVLDALPRNAAGKILKSELRLL